MTYLAPPTARAEVVVAMRGGEPSMFVLGPRSRASWKSTHGLTATATLHLRTGTLRAAFGVSPGELRDAAIPVGDVFDTSVVGRILDLAATTSVRRAARAFERELAGSAGNLLAENAVELALAGPRAMAAELGVSARTLRRIVGEDLGVSPRELSRFARAARVLARLVTARTTLAEIALDCGYADQAHMSNETRKLFGRSPRALAREAAHALVAR